MGNSQPRNRTGFGFATQQQALEYANEALRIASDRVLELQQKVLNSFNLLVAGRGDFGTDMLRTVDAHARTREFGALLWSDALIGQAVLELIFRERVVHNRVIERMIQQSIAHHESQRPHRRVAAWFRRLIGRPTDEVRPTLSPGEASLIESLARYEATKAVGHLRAEMVARVAAGTEPGDLVTGFPRDAAPLVAAIERPLEPGDLGEGTDVELAQMLAERAPVDNPEDSQEKSGTQYPAPEPEKLGNPEKPIDGADEYRENARRESEEKPQP